MNNDSVTKNVTTLNININDGRIQVVDRVLIKYWDYQNEEIVIPKGVTEVAKYSISITNAKVLHIPMSVDIIRSHAFLFAWNITKLYIENPDICLEVESLEALSNLKEVYIGGQRVETVVTQRSDKKNSVYLEKYVGEDKSYVVDDDITVIGNKSFSNCTTLESVEIPKSVEHIGTQAFGGCTALKEVNMSDSVNEISMWAFENCTSIRELTIPKNIEDWRISSEAFKGWKSNQIIRAPKHLKKLRFKQRWRKKCRAKIVYY